MEKAFIPQLHLEATLQDLKLYDFQVAGTLQGAVKRPNDLVVGYDGEEFVGMGALQAAPITGAVHVVETIRQAVRALEIPHKSSPMSGRVTMSLGATGILPMPEIMPAELIESAEAALYQAK